MCKSNVRSFCENFDHSAEVVQSVIDDVVYSIASLSESDIDVSSFLTAVALLTDVRNTLKN